MPTKINFKKTILNQYQHGFSLLELLVVITLMGLVAATASAFVNGLSEQERNDIPYDLTKTRLGQIRHAIIGDTSRTLNGEPVISGYVADMGRLPANINELIEQGNQSAWVFINLSSVTVGLTGQIWGGWRGPYLISIPEGAIRTFRDGWGTQTAPASPDDFGWVVRLSPVTVPACLTVPDCTDIAVQSQGADGLVGGNDFDADYPDPATGPLVRANEWQQTSTITFDIGFNKVPTCTPLPCTPPTISGLELRIYNFEDDVIIDGTGIPANAPKDSVEFRSSNPYAVNPGDPVVTFDLDGATNTVSVTITETFPMGRYAAVVWCSSNVVYDGDCDAGNPTQPNPKQPYYFTMLNSTSKITIPWNIP